MTKTNELKMNHARIKQLAKQFSFLEEFEPFRKYLLQR